MQPVPLLKQMTVLLLLAWLLPSVVCAQQDSARNEKGIVPFLKRQKGIVGKLANNLVGDTVASDLEIAPVPNDRQFRKYEGAFIRNITIQRLDFGTLLVDTARNFRNTFTKLANTFHHKSREFVIRNNLFFKSGDKVQAFLLADNERHLRDQVYIQDAKIFIIPVPNARDSVDILIRTKDVLSIGGSFELQNTASAELVAREENLAGTGQSIQTGVLYNQIRNQRTGVSAQYIYRNIGGSFMDGTLGFTTFNNTINAGQKEEKYAYLQFTKPLVNAYTKWTYSFGATNRETENMFWTDSLYKSDIKYHFYTYDGWVGWNTGAYKLARGNEDDRLRTLVGLRYFKQLFLDLPGKYANQYYFLYADVTGVLGSLSIFRQNFYKAQYFYGFGRNEDVPEGIDLSLTAGWVNKQAKNRPYVGVDISRYFFSANKAYYNFTLRSGTYWGQQKPEDFAMLFSMDHYGRLRYLGSRWKQRTVVNASVTGQVNPVLNAPLSLQSVFGLDEWKNSLSAAGDFRATLRTESVFFSPFTFINFHFAPFIFGNLCAITPYKENLSKTDLYSSIGGGIRTRNESLIFGTFELKVFYFPRKTFTGDSWRIETNTGIKFKYNSQLIKRPDLIIVN